MNNQDKKFLISILILNWNGEDLLEPCLQSVLATIYPYIEIIVVDNASSDNSLSVVSRFPSVKILPLESNLGFAAGNNAGFQIASGDAIVTLNNDTVVDPAWLNSVAAAFQQDPRVGIVSCRQMRQFTPEVIDSLFLQPSRFFIPDMAGAGCRFIGSRFEDVSEGFVFGAPGASAIWRSALLKQLGGFDARYFAYHEESDLCMRAFLDGWRCRYLPDAIVLHRGSVSFKKVNVLRWELLLRNKMRYIVRFYPWSYICRALPRELYRETRMFIRFCLLGHPLRFFAALNEGVCSGLKFYGAERSANIARFTQRREYWEKLLRRGCVSECDDSSYSDNLSYKKDKS